MQRKSVRFAGLSALGVVAALAASLVVANAQAPSRSVWDGVYSSDQADRGKLAYQGQCTSCHGDNLGGVDVAPPLAGSKFLGNWSGTSAGDLFERIQSTMPESDPGSLGGRMVADIEAYIFQVNGFPAGASELPNNAQQLQTTQILGTNPTPATAVPAPAANSPPVVNQGQ